MVAKINLKKSINEIATALDAKAELCEKFGTEYKLYFVTNEKLENFGFEFVGFNVLHHNPMYRYENLEAIFEDSVLYLYETTV